VITPPPLLSFSPGTTVTLTCTGNAGPAGAEVSIVRRLDNPHLGVAYDVRGVWGGVWWCLENHLRPRRLH
jgi:hypothetical protein